MKRVVIIRRNNRKGRSVYALKDFKEGEVIEICPVITLNKKERKACEKTILNSYIYPWTSTVTACIALGYGSIYNHSYEPNADWKQNFKTKSMVYRAIEKIKKGEEILINYNGEPDDNKEIIWQDWDKHA